MTYSLAGKRIVITRASHQYGELAALLCREGAEPLPYPAISIAPPEDTNNLDEALRAASAGAFDWVIFTSANTIAIVASRLVALHLQGLVKASVAAVGNGTAAAVWRGLGKRVDFVPHEAHALALAEALPLRPGARVLLPQSQEADETLATALAARGARVTALTAYRVMQGEGGVDLPRLIEQVNAITFTSGSTVDYFVRRFTEEGGRPADLEGIPIAYVGASTRRALRLHALSPTVGAQQHSLESLTHALKETFHAR